MSKDKRISVSGCGQSSSASTDYYVILECSEGNPREVKAMGKRYGEITKNDVGTAYIRDPYLVDYRRLTINGQHKMNTKK